MDVFRQIAERKIVAAIEEGEFDNLPGRGKPIIIEDLSAIPEHLRMVYLVLKSAGVIPEELQLRRQVMSLKNMIKTCFDSEERKILEKKLTETEIRYNLIMERNLRSSLHNRRM